MVNDSPHLTDRERQVLRLVAAGRTNGEIAEELGISFSTAKWHVSELLSKAGVESREELAAYWRVEHSPQRRLARIFSTALPFAPFKTAAFVGIAGVATVSAVFVASVAVSSGDVRPDRDAPAIQAASPAPVASRILGVFPGDSLPLDAESQGLVDKYMDGDLGVCARVSTHDWPSNTQPAQLSLDGVDVSNTLPVIWFGGVPSRILCHFGVTPLASGTHSARVTVSDPVTGVFLEQKDWTFEIP